MDNELKDLFQKVASLSEEVTEKEKMSLLWAFFLILWADTQRLQAFYDAATKNLCQCGIDLEEKLEAAEPQRKQIIEASKGIIEKVMKEL